MNGAISPLPQYVFMAWCLVKHRDKFTFSYIDMTRDPLYCLTENLQRTKYKGRISTITPNDVKMIQVNYRMSATLHTPKDAYIDTTNYSTLLSSLTLRLTIQTPARLSLMLSI
jgi:hypothetical protein